MGREHENEGRESRKTAVRALRTVYLMILSGFLAVPAVASGQTSAAGIAGDVRDTSGAVLPGVTVEAASPALIEKVRTVVTDAAGQYKLVELRPGSYSVTFTLPGFSTVRREGIELTTGFTATVNAEMQVGALEETITVSGAPPVVDVLNTQTRSVLTTEVLDTLPAARSFQGFGSLTLGVVTTSTTGGAGRDVGGNAGDWFGSLTIHGVRGNNLVLVEGLDTRSIMGEGFRRQQINYGALEETVLSTAAAGAEWEGGGVSVNFIPKEGSNTFRGVLYGDYAGAEIQSTNLDDDLRRRGVTQPSSSTKFVYDVYGGLGGPIVKDRLWFYTAHRWNGARQEFAGVYYNKLQGTLFYEPDLSRPADIERPAKQYYHERFTWRVASKHKVTLTASDEDNCACPISAGGIRFPEASWWGQMEERIIQPGWTYTATNRLLLEAGVNRRWDIGRNPYAPGATKNDRAVFDLALGRWYGSLAGGANPSLFGVNGWLDDYGTDVSKMWSGRAALSYVSGSHAFKTGLTHFSGWLDYGPGSPNFPEAYQFRNRVPVGLWQLASPGLTKTAVKAALGLYAQDQWTIENLTLNLGLRFDYLNAYSPETVRPGGVYVPELRFDAAYDRPNWKDLNPRFGMAYDLFGNGRTALKASFGRYVVTQATRIAQETSPADSITGTVFRTWSDANGDYVPDCNLKSPLANGECGAMANQRFGTPVVTRRYAEDFLTGWGKRGYNWQASASVQHELMPGFALNIGYHRTVNRGLLITDNLAVTPADYDPFCITAPVDSRLPGGGGNQICGLYDLRPEKFGLVDNLVNKSDGLRDVYNGVEIGMNARFGQGGMLFGGVSLGQRTLNNCVLVDTPDLRFCKTSDEQKQVKIAGSYLLPWGVQASATFQNLPGINRLANFVVGNAEIAPSLGRNLGACRGAATCTATVTVPLIELDTLREPRQNQLDVRLSKPLRTGRVRIEPKFEVFNVFNANDPQATLPTYGPAWLNVTSILAGRLAKFGAQVTF